VACKDETLAAKMKTLAVKLQLQPSCRGVSANSGGAKGKASLKYIGIPNYYFNGKMHY
jgi:hypothetical protein